MNCILLCIFRERLLEWPPDVLLCNDTTAFLSRSLFQDIRDTGGVYEDSGSEIDEEATKEIVSNVTNAELNELEYAPVGAVLYERICPGLSERFFTNILRNGADLTPLTGLFDARVPSSLPTGIFARKIRNFRNVRGFLAIHFQCFYSILRGGGGFDTVVCTFRFVFCWLKELPMMGMWSLFLLSQSSVFWITSPRGKWSWMKQYRYQTRAELTVV